MFQEFEGAERDFLISLQNVLATAITDIHPLERNAESMAKAAHGVLRNYSAGIGQNPDAETFIRAPGEPRHFDDLTCWCVAWESGPYQWAIGASMDITMRSGKLCEPYYSFDLCFYPGED